MRVEVIAHPGTKVSRVIKDGLGNLNVYVKAPPVKGRANNEIVTRLSKYFGVNQSEVILVEGAKIRYKVFEILKDDEPSHSEEGKI